MSKKQTHPERKLRIAQQIQRELSDLIKHEVNDPRLVGMITLQSVDLTSDYAHARVWFTLFSGDPEQVCTALNQAAHHLRRLLFKRLCIHTVPQLHFSFDVTLERAEHLSRLIDQANY